MRKEAPKKSIGTGPKGQKDREIARLRRELAAERRRNAALERKVSALRRELQIGASAGQEKPLRRLKQKAQGTHREERLLEDASRRAHHYRKGSFFRYLWESVLESAPVQIIDKMVHYLRRIRVIRMILTILLALSAVIAVAVVSAALLPFLFFGIALLTLLAFLRSHRMNRILKRELGNCRIRIMIPPRGGSLAKGSFFIRNARAMAGENQTAIIVVTPYLLSPRGLGGRGGFFTARKEADNLYLVRRHYYFFLRKRVLDTLNRDITVIY